jgi:DEAD/DEAH box helicase domain-containing protein
LIEKEVELVEENGAPAGEKLFVFYNPPMINRNLGIRRSYVNEATRVAKEILGRKLQTIVFANSRLHTEVILTLFAAGEHSEARQPEPIRGYRGGYLPGERREIERGRRDGRWPVGELPEPPIRQLVRPNVTLLPRQTEN